MKRFLSLLLLFVTAACSSMLPYKDQTLVDLEGIEKDPSAHHGRVVAFSGDVKGSTEDARHLRLVLKVEAPLYYSVTGKGDSLSYQLLLVHFQKETPAMTGILKGSHIKVLARVAQYETRNSNMGEKISVLHLEALAVSDRSTEQDFYQTRSPEKQLYESWKDGRLFFKETAKEIEDRYAAPTPQISSTPQTNKKDSTPSVEERIVFDEEEEFVLSAN